MRISRGKGVLLSLDLSVGIFIPTVDVAKFVTWRLRQNLKSLILAQVDRWDTQILKVNQMEAVLSHSRVIRGPSDLIPLRE